MIDVLFQCGGCSKHVAVGESFIGKWFRCPDCGEKLQAPPPTIVFSCVACHNRLSAPDALRGSEFLCPNCKANMHIPDVTTIPCPGCGVGLELDDEDFPELMGQNVDCPACGAQVSVPVKPGPPAPRPKDLPSGFGHKTIRLDELIESIPQAHSLKEGRCPYCASKIHQMDENSYVCRACGRLIQTVKQHVRRA